MFSISKFARRHVISRFPKICLIRKKIKIYNFDHDSSLLSGFSLKPLPSQKKCIGTKMFPRKFSIRHGIKEFRNMYSIRKNSKFQTYPQKFSLISYLLNFLWGCSLDEKHVIIKKVSWNIFYKK